MIRPEAGREGQKNSHAIPHFLFFETCRFWWRSTAWLKPKFCPHAFLFLPMNGGKAAGLIKCDTLIHDNYLNPVVQVKEKRI